MSGVACRLDNPLGKTAGLRPSGREPARRPGSAPPPGVAARDSADTVNRRGCNARIGGHLRARWRRLWKVSRGQISFGRRGEGAAVAEAQEAGGEDRRNFPESIVWGQAGGVEFRSHGRLRWEWPPTTSFVAVG